MCALLAAPVAKRINFPAPFFTGPLLASAVLFGSGVVTGALPAVFVTASYITIGAVAGARFTGVDRRYLTSCLPAGLGGVAVAVGITCAAAWPAAVWLDLPFMQVWLAFAPGGFEAMTALALALDADPVFVAGHQFVRLMALFMLAPWLFRNAGKGDKQRGKKEEP
ncbi:MAG: AbrB family transcriptional regulator [Rhodospirillales bacterium]